MGMICDFFKRKKVMGKEYFNKVDFDAAFPKAPVEPAIELELTTVPSPEEPLTVEERLEVARQTIADTLTSIRLGTSKLTPYAINFKEENTPFCLNLRGITKDITASQILMLIEAAKMDFGYQFSEFVKAQLRYVFNGDK